MCLPRLFSFFVTCLLLLALATCGKDSPTKPAQPAQPTQPTPPTPQPPAPAVPTRITITPSAASLTSIGQTVQLIAAVIDNNGAQIPGATVTWSSDRPAVATVSATGLVTAVSNGTATITARTGSVSLDAIITVSQSPGSITIEPAMATLMAISETVQLTATVLDQNGQPVEDAVITWQSSDESVATVNATGLVTAVMNGTATITARSGTASSTSAIKVMQEAGSITIEPAMATLMAIGETVQLTATVLDQNGQPVENAVITWQSSDENVATVSEQGLVTAVGDGSAQIIARSGEVSETINVNVSIEITEPLTDREVLISFYNKMNGPDWTTSTNWLSDRPLGTWHGVETNSAGEVTALNLLENNLAGPIPRELEQLSELRRLELSFNRLSGSIPPELGQLANLWDLGLKRNNLSGSIPRELGQLGNLHTLNLSANRLNGRIPPETGQLNRLVVLSIDENQISGDIPSELGQLSSLGSLGLSRNQLTGTIPEELGHLSNLMSLRLNLNAGLHGPLPYSMVNLGKLEILYLEDTQICIPPRDAFQSWFGGIPDRSGGYNCADSQRDALIAFFDQTDGPNWTHNKNWSSFAPLDEWYGVTTDSNEQITGLDLANNNLGGKFPSRLNELTGLRSLDLSFNPGLSGVLPINLLQLDLDDLKLEGTGMCAPPDTDFQDWLVGIPNATVEHCPDPRQDFYPLTALYENSNGKDWTRNTNWLSDEPLGTWYGVTTNGAGEVVRIELGNNNLQGVIPAEIGKLTRLTMLHLGSNRLSGTIPPELGQLDNLRDLWLSKNQLTGEIPPELGQLQNLEVLLLGANNLTGSIPATLGQLGNLRSLDLHVNRLSGSLPPELGQLGNLRTLLLYRNFLTGSIPPSFGNLTDLIWIYLTDNRLDGPIPPELGQLEKLTRIYITNNRLTGSIPTELGQLQELEWILLEGNNLTGSIPPELGRLDGLERLKLGNNRLSGPIPPELGSLRRLKLLLLANNQLTGTIPEEIGQLGRLEELSLSFNRLTGNVPVSLGDLSRLKKLGLTGNTGLAGTLPRTFTSLDLDELLVDGTELCAPNDPGFLVWLRAIPNSRVTVCGPRIGGSSVYLTQVTQSLSHPAPLVAGEDALLRVFVTQDMDADVTMPPVRAAFYQDDVEVLTVNIPAAGVPVPRQIDEGNLTASANASIPGSILLPGLEMVVEIDPDGVTDPTLGISNRLPTTGRNRLDVREVPLLKLTMVPYLWTENPDHSIPMRLEGLTEESDLFRQTRDLLPVKDFELVVHDPVSISVDPTWDNQEEVMRLTTMISTMEGASGHYMGIVRDGGGWAHLPGNVFISIIDESTIAHELGHNFNLLHAPCGNAGGPDPDFPQSDGSIGNWGYDLLDETLVTPDTPDLMSYCRPRWISDYHFSKAMGYRLSKAPTFAAAVTSPARSLLLWGGVDGFGELILEPAFVVDAIPSTSRLDGRYRIAGVDTDGRTLFEFSFGMAEIADGEGGSFAFVVPVRPDWAGRLDRITLSGPGGVVTQDGRDDPAAVLWLDPLFGTVRGLLRDQPSIDLSVQAARRVLPEPGLEMIRSWSNR